MKNKPMKHQQEALDASQGKRNFAYIMEQGCGKTFTTLDDAERLFLSNSVDGGRIIEALAIIAPNGVHTNWTRKEIPKHMDIFTVCVAWRSGSGYKTKKWEMEYDKLFADHYPNGKQPLRVFSINIDAVRTKDGYDHLERFLKKWKCMLVIDESTIIKNPNSVQTKKCIKIGKLATCRRILTGTPIPKAPTDLFSQFQFLKSGLLGTTSYRSFVAEFTVLIPEDSPLMFAIKQKSSSPVTPQIPEKDEKGRPIYKNLEKLTRLLAPHCFRVTKKEALDLPPKIYQEANFDLTPELRKHYDEMYNEHRLVLETEVGPMVDSFVGIAARAKLKQITSGYIKRNGEVVYLDGSDNPRLEVFKQKLLDLYINETPFLVWAREKEEINAVMNALKEAGIVAAKYDGDVKQNVRDKIIDDFAEGKLQAVVLQLQAGARGIEFVRASQSHYFSCSEDNELMTQSEDRNHRIGTKEPVLYIDYIANDTIDEDVQAALRSKTEVAEKVLDKKLLDAYR